MRPTIGIITSEVDPDFRTTGWHFLESLHWPQGRGFDRLASYANTGPMRSVSYGFSRRFGTFPLRQQTTLPFRATILHEARLRVITESGQLLDHPPVGTIRHNGDTVVLCREYKGGCTVNHFTGSRSNRDGVGAAVHAFESVLSTRDPHGRG